MKNLGADVTNREEIKSATQVLGAPAFLIYFPSEPFLDYTFYRALDVLFFVMFWLFNNFIFLFVVTHVYYGELGSAMLVL